MTPRAPGDRCLLEGSLSDVRVRVIVRGSSGPARAEDARPRVSVTRTRRGGEGEDVHVEKGALQRTAACHCQERRDRHKGHHHVGSGLRTAIRWARWAALIATDARLATPSARHRRARQRRRRRSPPSRHHGYRRNARPPHVVVPHIASRRHALHLDCRVDNVARGCARVGYGAEVSFRGTRASTEQQSRSRIEHPDGCSTWELHSCSMYALCNTLYTLKSHA